MVASKAPSTPVQERRGNDGAAEPASRSGTGSAPERPVDRSPRYALLVAPDYDNIVGGAPPSPFVSTLLSLGVVVLVAAAAGMAFGIDVTDWWLAGGLLAGIALLLAGFVSRTG